MREKWEHKIITCPFDCIPDLDGIGTEGWELVAVTLAGQTMLWAFKRRA